MDKWNGNSGKASSGFFPAIMLVGTFLIGIVAGAILWSMYIASTPKPLPDIALKFNEQEVSSKCVSEKVSNFRSIRINASQDLSRLISIDNSLVSIISECYVNAPVKEESTENTDSDTEKVPLK